MTRSLGMRSTGLKKEYAMQTTFLCIRAREFQPIDLPNRASTRGLKPATPFLSTNPPAITAHEIRDSQKKGPMPNKANFSHQGSPPMKSVGKCTKVSNPPLRLNVLY
jgi:hypothetical protein